MNKKQIIKNNQKKVKVLFYVYFADQTVMPFIHEIEKYFDVDVLVYKNEDNMLGGNRKLEKGPNILKCDLMGGGVIIY